MTTVCSTRWRYRVLPPVAESLFSLSRWSCHIVVLKVRLSTRTRAGSWPTFKSYIGTRVLPPGKCSQNTFPADPDARTCFLVAATSRSTHPVRKTATSKSHPDPEILTHPPTPTLPAGIVTERAEMAAADGS